MAQDQNKPESWPATPPGADEFWEFSLRHYNRPEIAKRLLALQDDHQCDVNVMLLMMWCSARSLVPDSACYARLLKVSQDWQTGILGPHREARRRARGTPAYDFLKKEELVLERSAQKALLRALHLLVPHTGMQSTALALYLAKYISDEAAAEIATDLTRPTV